MRILFIPGSRNAPAARFRLWQFVRPLQALGHDLEIRIICPERYWSAPAIPAFFSAVVGYAAAITRLVSALWITRDIERFDVVVMNRDLVPEVRIRFLEPWLARRNPRIIFDFDDAIFYGRRADKMAHILPCFSRVSAGNEYLAKFARKYSKHVVVWPTVVDTARWVPRKLREQGPIRIGWSGSRSTMEHCLPVIEGALVALAKEILFEFVVVSDAAPHLKWPGVLIRYIPWSPDTEIASLQLMDVGIMPLKSDEFQRGKCGAKAITYMSIGIPAVVSPVGTNSEIVTPGVDGYHCSCDEDWIRHLRELIQDEAMRFEMGRRARETAIARYSVQSLLPRMNEAFESVQILPKGYR